MWSFKTNRLHRQTLYAGLILALLSVVLVVALRRAEAKRPDVVIYSSDFKMPVNRGPLFDRIVPPSWAWAWKLRDKIRGKVKEVMIGEVCLEIRSTAEATVNALNLNAPTLERNGTRIWLLTNTHYMSLWKRVAEIPGSTELVNKCNITVVNREAVLGGWNRIPAMAGVINSCLSLETSPRIDEDKVDLTSVITYSEVFTPTSRPKILTQSPLDIVRTNALVATRIQFPTNSSVLILAPDKSGATNRCIALILTAKFIK